MNLTKKQITIYYISIIFFIFSFICVLIICFSKNRNNGYINLDNNSDHSDNTNKNINQKLETIEENIEENVDTDYDNDSLFDV
tara:strand:- start:1211 stop:1459 length:249 start_codon:yes stop_codon:yes gene_type:complete